MARWYERAGPNARGNALAFLVDSRRGAPQSEPTEPTNFQANLAGMVGDMSAEECLAVLAVIGERVLLQTGSIATSQAGQAPA